MTKQAILDLNFWFHKGAKESPEVYDMISTSGDGSYGLVSWDEWTEENFLPNLFTPHSIFKLLYKDETMIPEWAYTFDKEDIYVTLRDSNGNTIEANIALNPETGDIKIETNKIFDGSILLVGKTNYLNLPQFFIKDFENMENVDGVYKLVIPQEEHGFIGTNIIESIRSKDGQIVEVEMSIIDNDIHINSNVDISGRGTFLGETNQANLYVKNIDMYDWFDEGEYYSYTIFKADHNLIKPANQLLIRTKNEMGNTVDTGIRFSGEDIIITSNILMPIKVLIFDEKSFYEGQLHDQIWLTDSEPYKIIIPKNVHGLFDIPTKIDHHIKSISLNECTYLPNHLRVLLDTYYNINSLWLVVDDPEDVYESVLKNPEQELEALQLLAKSKDYTFGDPGSIDIEEIKNIVLNEYIPNFDNQTPLVKNAIMEMFYLHFNENDNFEILNKMIDELPSYSQQSDHGTYNLMTNLYSYMVINKILKRKIIDNEGFIYTPDYWDNK